MSKLLVAFFNNTSVPLSLVNFEDVDNDQTVEPYSMFRTKVHFNVPDMSDCSKYFNGHHMEVRTGSQILFSFWDNDNDNYKLCYCSGTTCSDGKLIPDYYDGGNNATVGVVVDSTDGLNFTIRAVHVNNDV